MANSSIIDSLKKAVIKEICNDEALFYAINSPRIKNRDKADELIGTHIFPYHKNVNTITDVMTFLTVQVHIPKTYDKEGTWVTPQLEIFIISHNDHMDVDNIPKISANRNDYISILLDEKFNGRNSVGGSKNEKYNQSILGELKLITNTEGAFSEDFLYRRMIFELKDLNDSMCDK